MKTIDHKVVTRVVIFFSVILSTTFSHGEMKTLADADLKDISASSGIVLVPDVEIEGTIEDLFLYDNDGDSFGFHDMVLRNTDYEVDGDFPYYRLTGQYSIDIGTEGDKTYLRFKMPGIEDATITASQLEICQDKIGSVELTNTAFNNITLFLSQFEEGQNGVALELRGRAEIDDFRVVFGENDYFGFENLVLAKNFTKSGTEWIPDGNFKIGMIQDYPLSFNVGTDDNGDTRMNLTFTMAGSIRSTNVHVGGMDIGPFEVDGLKIEYLRFIIDPDI